MLGSGRTITFLPWTADTLPHITLAPQQVDLWSVRLDVTDEVVAGLAASLAADEHARAQRFVFARERRRFSVARGTLRHLLSVYRDVPPEQHRFVYGPHGKPALAPGTGPDVQFNLAHSEELAIYAFAATLTVGIDVEALRPLPEALALARRYFSPNEYTRLAGLPDQEQLLAFFRCWTRKEAYLKATGEGISRALANAEVRFGPGEAPVVSTGPGGLEWTLYHLEPSPGSLGALAVAGHDHRCRGWSLEHDGSWSGATRR